MGRKRLNRKALTDAFLENGKMSEDIEGGDIMTCWGTLFQERAAATDSVKMKTEQKGKM